MKYSHPTQLAIVALAFSNFLLANEGSSDPALTIYNKDLAVVRQTFPIKLKKGVNEISFSGVTSLLEPQSVILKSNSETATLSVIEQSYRADTISPGLILKQFEGKEIDFLTHNSDPKLIRGKVIRSGYNSYTTRNRNYQHNQENQQIIEVDGKFIFGLPGAPQYDSLPDNSILEPTISWIVNTDKAQKSTAELAYMTGGFKWISDYNLMGKSNSDLVDIVGWVSMENFSGTSFRNAKIKLIAGDVNRARHPSETEIFQLSPFEVSGYNDNKMEERSFDEYHLYELPRRTTLLNKEVKQVEFLRAQSVRAKTIYIYDGAATFLKTMRKNSNGYLRYDESFGTISSKDVWVMREIENSKQNNLGLPLPAGKTRFYREDTDGQLEFTGENIIDHTPKKEMIRIYTGNAFDIIGERNRTNFQMDRNWYCEETYEITLKNRKDQAVTVRVAEHLLRWSNWEIKNNTDTFQKVDADTIAFLVNLDADSEKTISYTVRYSWAQN